MSERLDLIVREENNLRIDKLISVYENNLTRSAVQKLIEEERVFLNGKPALKSAVPSFGDRIEIDFPDAKPTKAMPENIPLNIVYEDKFLLVVNKQKGMVVHPAAGNESGTLVNALLYHCGDSLSGINGEIRPGIVHRIDKDTSGLLIVAKNDFAHNKLAKQIEKHSFERIYEAVVYGNIKEDSGTVDAPIGRNPADRKKMAVTEKNSRNAVTHFEVVKRYGAFTHVRFRLETGRTHQIRVHMAYIGHPIAGDPVYGPKKLIKELGGQCLHAKTISFVHPETNELMSFDSDLPDYFLNFLKRLDNGNF